jgi:photosystem II stability/assembly factor-like uncharacterized protein
MKQWVLVLLVSMLSISLLQGQQWSSYTTLLNSTDSTVKIISRSLEYTASGQVWVQATNTTWAGNMYVYRSTDDGATWTRNLVMAANSAISSPGISNITVRDNNIALIGTTGGEIYRTTNGGVAWTNVMTAYDMAGFVDAVRFMTPDTAIAFGDADASGTFVALSTNAGTTWTRFTNLPDSSKRASWFDGYASYGQAMDVYKKTAWIPEYFGAGRRPFLLRTTNAGTSWEEWPLVLPGTSNGTDYSIDYYLQAINFADDSTGFAIIRRVTSSSTTANYAIKTTNGGKTWSDTINMVPGSHNDAKVQCIKAIRGTNIVIASGYGTDGARVWKSTDLGVTWASMNAPLINANADCRNFVFLSANKGFIVGNQFIAKYSSGTGVAQQSEAVPKGYTLFQNYPNPFNPTTTMGYQLGKGSHVNLIIHDMLGRVIATVVDGYQSAGTYQVPFNGAQLPSGMYFYTLRAGEFTSTRSFVLLK